MSDLILAPTAAIQNLRRIFEKEEDPSRLDEQVVAELHLPGREARYAELPSMLPPMLQAAVDGIGISSLYTHQVAAITSLRAGHDTLIASPTASGKTLCYHLPVLETLLEDPKACALYLYPLKALARDQLRGLKEITDQILPAIDIAVYDGDTTQAERRKLRKRPPRILLTNPDMLHYGLLPYHGRHWEQFFSQLRYVILDEVHTYRGLFGANMAHVLRRLRRIASSYGADPCFSLSSATIGNARDLARRLVGRDARLIEEIGSPSPGLRLFLIDPHLTPHTLASRLAIACVKAGLKTIVFTKARRITELIYTWIVQSAPELAERVSSYRSGFLPEERREIEKLLFDGALDAVVSTSALEVGIDVGGLDACILVGYPGSITATFQRAGRVGRAGREGLVFLLAGADALDQYFVRHPEELVERGYEEAVVDPTLPLVLRGHLLSAAAEKALRLSQKSGGELLDPPFRQGRRAGASSRNDFILDDLECVEEVYDGIAVMPQLKELIESRRLDPAPTARGGLLFSSEPYPQRQVEIRGPAGTFTIFDQQAQQIVGSVSGFRALLEGHPGAVYLHRGRTYLVDELSIDDRDIRVRPARLPYYTKALTDKHTEVLETLQSRPLGNVVSRFGRLRVTTTIHSYEKRRTSGQDLMSTHPLDLPPHVLDTVGMWLEIDAELCHSLTAAGFHLMGSLHATEHCAIGLSPLFALCDRFDLAGICYPEHPQLQKAAIFIYDAYDGGVGLAHRLWELGERVLDETFRAISSCRCDDGCPSCIQSPRCGSGNKPLDKLGAEELLQVMLARRPIPVRSPRETTANEPAPTNATEEKQPIEPNVVVFDVETQRSADEVGGWHNAHLMRVAVVVAHESATDRYHVFEEHQLEKLFDLFESANLIVGFNIKKFDYSVLRAYAARNLGDLPTLDLLEEVQRACGRRIGLSALGEVNFGEKKSADGLLSLQWWKEGKLDKITSYCRDDVRLTRQLFEKGRSEGFVLIPGRRGRPTARLPVRWKLNDVLGDESL